MDSLTNEQNKIYENIVDEIFKSFERWSCEKYDLEVCLLAALATMITLTVNETLSVSKTQEILDKATETAGSSIKVAQNWRKK